MYGGKVGLLDLRKEGGEKTPNRWAQLGASEVQAGPSLAVQENGNRDTLINELSPGGSWGKKNLQGGERWGKKERVVGAF